jgi:hypothetical protein
MYNFRTLIHFTETSLLRNSAIISINHVRHLDCRQRCLSAIGSIAGVTSAASLLLVVFEFLKSPKFIQISPTILLAMFENNYHIHKLETGFAEYF